MMWMIYIVLMYSYLFMIDDLYYTVQLAIPAGCSYFK
jgi:hypothetical protein